MTKKYPPITQKCKHFLHGADYNPEQWMETPEIWDEDMRLMKLARCNVMSVGIFSWTNIEKREGHFDFSWLDKILDKMAESNVYAILATPSGARPVWMSAKYPEVLRVRENRIRNLHGMRHNHCFTSPVYREKTQIINRKLAERYKEHPALIMWHISNEFGGECHCELCQEAFREWLKKKYEGDLDKLNHAWWTSFWSHTFTDWSQIESPAMHGEHLVHGHSIDWRRFVTHQTIDFFENEIVPLRELTPDIPVTTNFMRSYEGLDYWKFAEHVDIVSWDSYPMWHGTQKNWDLGSDIGFMHDIFRSLKGGRPYMLMESTPSNTNWQEAAKLKRPSMHLLSSIQALAHGSETVQYFQWRKSRGASEKLHGAVVDHCGHENTRVFRDVAEVGETLEKLDDILGTTVKPDAAIIFDWENRWAINELQGLTKGRKDYLATVENHYRAFWRRAVPLDIINMDCDFSSYKLLIAPMLYMVRPGVAERIEDFVKKGGTFVATYWSGIVDENDLCFLGGFPGPLRNVLGIWAEELDSLYEGDRNAVSITSNELKGLSGEYEALLYCDLIHEESARVLAEYTDDFYKGRPALTVNSFGKGSAYYMAFRNDSDFLMDFYSSLIEKLSLKKAINSVLPEGVTAQVREDTDKKYIFILNFTDENKTVKLDDNEYTDILSDEEIKGSISLEGYGLKILVLS